MTLDSTGDFKVNGPMVGGAAGYNVQFGSSFSASRAISTGAISGLEATNCGGNCQTSNNWLGTARGRIGYAFDRFLPYITGGGAFGDVKGSLLGVGDFKQTKAGWTGGAASNMPSSTTGRPSSNISMSISARRPATQPVPARNPITATFKSNVVRGGLNYKF